MKIRASVLALCLFGHVPKILDLDTGRIFDAQIDAAEITKLANKRVLPLYSSAPIYQSYISLAKTELGFDIGDWDSRYPQFEFVANLKPDGTGTFYKEADVLCSMIEEFALRKQTDRNCRSIWEFGKYLDSHKSKFAKEWCQKEGYEWYDE